MSYDLITKCPVCDNKLEIIKVHCPHCDTSCEGRFTLDKFSYLTQDEKYFIEVFLKCRGNIKDVEKELGISYPTVRNKLDNIINHLGYEVNYSQEKKVDKEDMLNKIERGEISVDEAIERFKK